MGRFETSILLYFRAPFDLTCPFGRRCDQGNVDGYSGHTGPTMVFAQQRLINEMSILEGTILSRGLFWGRFYENDFGCWARLSSVIWMHYDKTRGPVCPDGTAMRQLWLQERHRCLR